MRILLTGDELDQKLRELDQQREAYVQFQASLQKASTSVGKDVWREA